MSNRLRHEFSDLHRPTLEKNTDTFLDTPNSGEFVVTTFPLGARTSVPKLGLLATSLVSDVLSKRHDNVTSQIAINVLDSYADRSEYLEPLLSAHEKLGIDLSNAWIDNDPKNIEVLYQEIDTLVRLGFVTPETTEVTACADSCLRVEMLSDAIVQPKGKIYHKDEQGEIVCDACGEVAKKREQETLIMRTPTNTEVPTVYPYGMQKDSNELANRVAGSKSLISRIRDTGITYTLEGKDYNIDVDFFWMNFLNDLAKDKDGIILVGSNHVRRQLMTMAAYYQATNSENPQTPDLKIVMPSYITNAKGFENFVNGDYQNEPDPNALRLLILSSISWMKDTQWAMPQYKYFKRRLAEIEAPSGDTNALGTLIELYQDCEEMKRAALMKSLQSDRPEQIAALRGIIE